MITRSGDARVRQKLSKCLQQILSVFNVSLQNKGPSALKIRRTSSLSDRDSVLVLREG